MTDYLIAVSKGSVPLFSKGHAVHLVTAALAMSLNNYITDLMQLYEPHTKTDAPHEGTCYLYKVNLQSEFAKWITNHYLDKGLFMKLVQYTWLLQHYVPQQLYNWVIKLTSSNFMNPIQIQPLHMKAPVISTKWICKVNYKPLFRQRPLQETGTVRSLWTATARRSV